MIDLRQTPEYAKYMESLGWEVVRFQVLGYRYQVFVRKIPFLGKIAKLQRPERQVNIKVIQNFIKNHNVSVMYVEPQIPLAYSISPTFSLSKTAFLPSKTILVDLKKSEERLLKEMKPKTRYNIKIAKKNGVVVKKSQDIESFVKLWHSQALKRGMFLSQKKEIEGLFKFFDKRALLLLAFSNSTSQTPQAGVLLCNSSDTAFYMYAAGNREGKKLFAPTLIVWEAIKHAKRNKLKYFDFEGVFDERYPKQTKAWKGFTRFKEGFGGKIVEYPKTLVHYKNPIVKLLSL